jgi:hypothetical protein
MDAKNPFHPYTRPAEREVERPHAGASEWELRQEPPPHRADAFDRMSRRLSGTIDPEAPGNEAPVLEGEGQLADPLAGSK